MSRKISIIVCLVIVALFSSSSVTTGQTRFRVDKEGKLSLPGPVLFQTGSDKLLPESDVVLNYVKKYLDSSPKVTLFRIEVHTDSDGPAAANMDLSKRRSMSIARWLISKGIDCMRLFPAGFGDTKPIVKPEKTALDKATNRRVVFANTHIKGKPIGNRPSDGGGNVGGDPCAKK